LLIITPSALKYVWREELLKWFKVIQEQDIQIFVMGDEPFDPKCCIYIMSYNIATRIAQKIKNKEFKFIIADEAHCLK